MSIRAYEIIAAGAAENFGAQTSDKIAQRRRIVRFCRFKGIDCVPTSIICNNYRKDLDKACMLYRMGYADAIIIAGTTAWSAEEKEIFWKKTADNKVKIINLDELDWSEIIM